MPTFTAVSPYRFNRYTLLPCATYMTMTAASLTTEAMAAPLSQRGRIRKKLPTTLTIAPTQTQSAILDSLSVTNITREPSRYPTGEISSTRHSILSTEPDTR